MPFPLLAAAQMGAGLVQGIAGLIQNKRATKQLEGMQSPTYNQNASILDYYNKALAKYNVNPYNTDFFRMQNQLGQRDMASGISALQGRGQALAGVNNLVQTNADRMLKAGATAEDLSRQDLNRVGQAAGMKTAEDQRAFEINQMQPFERKYNLKALKAGGGADIMNAGLSNIFGGLSTANEMNMLDKAYKNPYGSSADYSNSINPSSVLRSLYMNQNRRVGTNRNVLIGNQ